MTRSSKRKEGASLRPSRILRAGSDPSASLRMTEGARRGRKEHRFALRESLLLIGVLRGWIRCFSERGADSFAERVVAFYFVFEGTELGYRHPLFRGGLLDRQAVVFLHRAVNAYVLVDLGGRDVLVVVLVG